MFKKEYVYVAVAIVAIYIAGLYLFPLQENFRMSTTTTCPECQDDSDCSKCGLVGSTCLKNPGSNLGTCKKV